MKAKINGSDAVLDGTPDEIISILIHGLASSKEEALRRFFANLADFYDGVSVPELQTISSKFNEYAHYAFTLSTHLGHLILIEGEDTKCT